MEIKITNKGSYIIVDIIGSVDMYTAVEGADVLVLCTEWNMFKSFDISRVKELMKKPLMFDGRNQFEPEDLRNEGFEYYGIGRGR